MGIQAPTTSDYVALVLTSLTSYNRPLVLFLVFIFSFGILYYLTKKKMKTSLAVSLVVVFIAALVFVASEFSKVRW